jgi:hypothetical protein
VQSGPLSRVQRAIHKGQLIFGLFGLGVGLLGLVAHWLAPSQALLTQSGGLSSGVSGFALMAMAGGLLAFSGLKRIRSMQARERIGPPPAG